MDPIACISTHERVFVSHAHTDMYMYAVPSCATGVCLPTCRVSVSERESVCLWIFAGVRCTCASCASMYICRIQSCRARSVHVSYTQHHAHAPTSAAGQWRRPCMIRSRAATCQAEGCENKAVYDKKYGADLWQIDVEQYDKVSSSLSCSLHSPPSLSCSLRSTESRAVRQGFLSAGQRDRQVDGQTAPSGW